MELINQFKNYLFSQKAKPSLLTVKNYAADTRHFISWFEEKFQKPFNPSDVTLVTIAEFKKDKHDLSASSLDRHVSSLRKFFEFLKLEGKIGHNPFDIRLKQTPEDPWHVKEFKDFLYVYNASRLTIKNYLIDVKQFLSWAEKVSAVKESYLLHEKNLLPRINDEMIEEYKTRLIEQHVFSPTSINRKLSSLRKYLTWASEQGLLQSDIRHIHGLGSDYLKKAAIGDDTDNARSSQTINPQDSLVSSNESEVIEAAKVIDRPTYSVIPPVRLFQKMLGGLDILLEYGVISPIVWGTRRGQRIFWKLQGKPVFVKSEISLKSQPGQYIPRIKNISKSIYAPMAISITHFPLAKKLLHHLRYTRPNWYRRYHQLTFAHYINWAVLIIFSTAIGFGMYSTFFQKTPGSQAVTLPNPPPRILSFQGRLTDTSDNPITARTDLRFAIYNDTTASGSSLLWQENVGVTPDSDGIFSVLLGKNTAIPASLFQSESLWLGVTVGETTELTPRQQIATVPYATNSEQLQGLVPITAAGAGNTNVVLALDGSGNLTIGAGTTFQSTGTFTLSGNTLVMNTTAGSNSNIVLNPDGAGYIDMQKPIINSSNNNNIASAQGSVEIDDMASILATSSGQSALTIAQNGTGPIISASSSGVAKFTVGNAGDITSANYTVNGGILYTNGSGLFQQTSAGSFGDCLGSNGGGAPSWVTCGGGASEFWNLDTANGALYPVNSTLDVLFGGTSSSSANFAFINNAPGSGTPTASISGNITLNSAGSIQTTRNQTLTIGGNTTGNIILSPLSGNGTITLNGTINSSLVPSITDTFDLGSGSKEWNNLYVKNIYTSGSGVVGFWQLQSGVLSPTNTQNDLAVGGNSTSSAKFQVFGDTGNATTSGNLTFTGTNPIISTTSMSTLTIGSASTGPIQLSPKGTAGLFVDSNGSVGVGNTTPGTTLDVTGSFRVSGNATFSNTTQGSIYFAGANGLLSQNNTNFFWDNSNVRLGIGTNSPLGALDVRGSSATAPVASISGQTSGTGLVVDNSGSGDLFSALTAGLPKFTISNGGTITTSGYSTGVLHSNSSGLITSSLVSLTSEVTGVLPIANGGTNTNATPTLGAIAYGNGTAYAFSGVGAAGECLLSGGAGTPTWSSCANGTGIGGFWNLDSTNGTLYPINTTVDLLIGGVATSSSKFAVTGINGSNTPSASVSATVSSGGNGNGIVLKGDGSIQSLEDNQLILGGNTTGDILLKPANGSGNGNVTIYGNTLNSNGTSFNLLTNATTLSIAGSSGTTTINNDLTVTGASTLNGNVTLGADNTKTITANGKFLSSLIPHAADAYNLGSSLLEWNDLYIKNIYSSGNISGFWQLNGGVLAPTNIQNDLAIGGNSTSSAKFQVFADTGNATTSGNLTFTGSAPTIQTTSMLPLTIGSATTGPIELSPKGTTGLFVDSAGNVGIGTTNPIQALSVKGTVLVTVSGGGIELTSNSGNTRYSLKYGVDGVLGGSDDLTLTNRESNGALRLATSGSAGGSTGETTRLYITSTGFIGIGTTSNIGNAQLVVNQTNSSGLGDIFTASAAGSTKFTIANDGTIKNSLLPNITNTYDLGSSNLEWNNIYGQNIFLNGQLLTGNLWQENSGVLSPHNITDDLAIGGSSTSSAKFQVFGLSTAGEPAGTASTSGELSFNTSSAINVLNGGNLGFYNSAGGDSGLSATPTLYVANYGGVGIGTNNPGGFLLKVTGTGGSLAYNANNTSTLDLERNGVNNIFADQAGGQLAFGTANTERVRIDQNGNVGIATTNPANFKLQVAGNIGPDTGSAYDLGSLSAPWNNIYANNLNLPITGGIGGFWQLQSGVLAPTNIQNDLAIGGNSTSSAKFQVFADTGNATTSGTLTFNTTGTIQTTSMLPLTIGSATTGPIELSPKGTTGLFVSSTGNVGIGTTNPIWPVDIRSSFTATTGFSTTLNINNTITAHANNDQFRSFVPQLTIAKAGFTGLQGILVDADASSSLLQSGSGTVATTYGLYASASSIGTTNYAIYSASGTNYFGGNVGIGTTTPLTTLQVSGSASESGNLSFYGNGTAHTVNYLDTGSLNFQRSAGGDTGLISSLLLDKNGNVGIGTTSPTCLLQVGGGNGCPGFSGQAVTYATGTPQISLSQSTGEASVGVTVLDGTNNQRAKLFVDNTNDVWGIFETYGGGSSKPFVLVNAGTEMLRVTGNGNVGIGTTSPLGLLNINGAPVGKALTILNETGDQDIFTASKSGSTKFTIQNSGALKDANYTTAGGLLFTDNTGLVSQTASGSLGQCLTSQAGSTPTWASCATGGAGTNWWTMSNGTLYPINSTLDFLLGGTATTSATPAKFAVTGMADSLTPAASVSATVSSGGNGNGIVLKGDGSIQSLEDNQLILGGNTTGDILLKPANGSGNGNVTIYGNTLNSNGTSFNLLTNATTLSIAGSSGTTNINNSVSVAGSSLDSTQSTFGLLATPTTINFGAGASTAVNIGNSSGAIALKGNVTLGNSSANTITTTGQFNSSLISNSSSLNIGSPTNYWGTVYANNFIAPIGNGISGLWQVTNNVISPVNAWQDLAVGGTGTPSANLAPLQVFALSYTNDLGAVPAGTATTSGNLTYRGTASSQTAFKTELLNGSNLGFYTSAGGDKGVTTTSPSLYIANTGNVAIGTSNPTTKFQVYPNGNSFSLGDGTSTSVYLSASGTRSGFGYDGTNAAIQAGAGVGLNFNVNNNTFGSGTVMSIIAAGNVGIGTTNPGAKLQVIGLTQLAGNSGFSASNALEIGNDAIFADYDTANSISLNGVNTSAEGGLRLGSGGGTLYGKSGDIGIGTTTPNQALEVSQAGGTSLVWPGRLTNTNNSNNTGYGEGIQFFNSTTGDNVNKWAGVAGVAQTVFANNVRLAFYTQGDSSGGGGSPGIAPTEKMTILGNGNVGIGTTTPTALLDIHNGVSYTNESPTFAANTTQQLTTTVGSYAYNSEFTMDGSSNHNRLQIAGYRMFNPTNDWAGTGYRIQDAIDSSYTDGSLSYIYVGSGNQYGGAISLGTNGSDRLFVQNDGNVGIGTTTPNKFLLQVAGNLGPNANDMYNLGSDPNAGGFEWNNIYVRQIVSPSTGGIAGYWQLNGGVLSPTNLTNDLAIGGAATSSAKFQVIGSGVNAGNLSILSSSTTGNVASIAATALTSGTLLNLTASDPQVNNNSGALLASAKIINVSSTDHTYMSLTNSDLTIGGHKNLITISNVSKVFIYDTTSDSDGGRWTNDERAQASSWYNEARTAADACNLSSSTRCGAQAFPRKAIIVATANTNSQGPGLYIFDAKDNSLWMSFTKGSGTTDQMIGPTTNSGGKSVFALNGKIYFATIGTGYGGLYVIDFKQDSAVRYDNSHGYQIGNMTIANRNSTITWNTNSNINTILTGNSVRDVYANVVNGKTYFAVATVNGPKGCFTLVNDSDESLVARFGVSSGCDGLQTWLTSTGTLYATYGNAATPTNYALKIKYNAQNAAGDNQLFDEVYANVGGTTNYGATTTDNNTFNSLSMTAGPASTSATLIPSSMYVTEGTSTVDGKSDTVYLGAQGINGSLMAFQLKRGDPWDSTVKYYTSTYITDDLYSDVRAFWPLDNNIGSGLQDVSIKGNNLTNGVSHPSYSASGVRGLGATLSSTTYASSSASTLQNNLNGQLVSGWVRATTVNTTSGNRLMWIFGDNPLDSSTTVSFGIGTKGDGTNAYLYCFASNANGTLYESNTGIQVQANTWYHVAEFSPNNNTINCYVNGQLTSVTPGANFEVPVNVGIGKTQHFNSVIGNVDDVEIAQVSSISGYNNVPNIVAHMYQVGYRALQNHSSQTLRGVNIAADASQELANNNSNVSAVAASMQNGKIYIGTNNGGVSVIGMDSDTLEDVYNSNITTKDDSGTPWATPFNYVVSLAVGQSYGNGSLLSIGSFSSGVGGTAGAWMESNDTTLKDFFATNYNPFGSTLNQNTLNVDSVLRVTNAISTRLDNLALDATASAALADVFRVDHNGTLLSRSLLDSTTAMQFQNSFGTTLLDLDTANSSIGIGTTAPKPGTALDIEQNAYNTALLVNQQGSSDIIAASTSGTTQFRVTNGGSVVAHSFYDLDSFPSYFLDPAAGGTALDIAGSEVIASTSALPNKSPLQISVNTGNATGVDVFNYGATPLFVGYRADGTQANPTPVQSGDALTAWAGRGFVGPSFTTVASAAIQMFAAENWTSSANGSYMTFETTPTGSTSRAERMRILANGNVGIGTTNPGAKLQVTTATSADGIWLNGTGGNPQFVMLNNGTGEARIGLATGAGAFSTDAIANDIIFRTESTSTHILFNTNAGAGGSTMALINGNVGIGTTNPTYPFYVNGYSNFTSSVNSSWIGSVTTSGAGGTQSINSGQINNTWWTGIAGFATASNSLGAYGGTSSGSGYGGLFENTGGGYAEDLSSGSSNGQLFTIFSGGGSGWKWGVENSSNDVHIYSISNGCGGSFWHDNSGLPNARCSDERVKTDITSLTNEGIPGLEGIRQLNPVSFKWNIANDDGSTHWGLIAQQVQKIYPYLVINEGDQTKTLADGTTETLPNFLTVDYNSLIFPAIIAIKQLDASNSATLAQVQQLQSLELSQTGDIAVSIATPSADFTIPSYYSLSDALGNPISRMGAFVELVVGNLRVGGVSAQQVLTNSLAVATDNVSIAGQRLSDYIVSVVNTAISNGAIGQLGNGSNTVSPVASIDQVHTGIISPLGSDDSIALKLGNSRIDITKGASGSAVASIDSNGNATFSGQLNSQNLAVNGDATVSGTLHAGNIEANSIIGLQAAVGTLSAQNITNVTNVYFATPSGSAIGGNIATGFGNGSASPSSVPNSIFNLPSSSFADVASFSAYFAYVPNLKATTAEFENGLISLGPASLSDTSITGQLSIGSQLILADTSVNVLGADFNIQPLRQGGIQFEGGLIAMDTNGNLTVNGNTIVNGTLAAKIISPLAGNDLTIQLSGHSRAGGNPGNGSPIGVGDDNSGPNFNIQNASGSGVFTIDQLGNVIASGAAQIAKLNFTAIAPALAVSPTEAVATGSAGTAAVKANHTQITIDNPLVTDKSLIYITPVGQSNITPYLLKQVSGTSFTVGIPTIQLQDTTFNWLIVN